MGPGNGNTVFSPLPLIRLSPMSVNASSNNLSFRRRSLILLKRGQGSNPEEKGGGPGIYEIFPKHFSNLMRVIS